MSTSIQYMICCVAKWLGLWTRYQEVTGLNSGLDSNRLPPLLCVVGPKVQQTIRWMG